MPARRLLVRKIRDVLRLMRISVQVDRSFRRKWIADSGRSGSPISAEVDRFRPKWITSGGRGSPQSEES